VEEEESLPFLNNGAADSAEMLLPELWFLKGKLYKIILLNYCIENKNQ
jgi:hypothetical protein